MTLTTSSNSSMKEWKETYLWALKKSRGMMALLALLLFMALPMVLMIRFSSQKAVADTPIKQTLTNFYLSYFTGLAPYLITPLILVFVVILAVSLFSYMHQKRSVDLFHALPIGRVPMLLGRLCAGLTTIFLPILLNFLIAVAVGAAYQIDIGKYLPTVFITMLWLMLMSTAALVFSVLMAVCTGTTLDMVLSILGVNAAYPLLIFLGSTFASSLLPGLSMMPALNSTVLSAFSPFVAAFMPYADRSLEMHVNGVAATGEPSGLFLIWWIAFTLILLAGCILLYKKRKSESAENSFAFPLPKVIIRFMITAVVGLGLGLVLQQSTSNPTNFFIGVVSGSLAAHIVVEAIYSRGFKQLKHSFLYYGIFAAVFIVGYGVLATGFFGYDTRVPNAQDVASITIDAPSQSYSGDNYILNENHTSIAQIVPILKERASIDKTIALHQTLVTEKRTTAYPYCVEEVSPKYTLTYHLKNGKVMTRSYVDPLGISSISPTPIRDGTDLLSVVSRLNEFRENSSMLFYLDPEYIKSIDLNTKGGVDAATFAPDLNTKAELLEALKQDYLDGKISNGKDLGDNSIYFTLEYKDPIQLKDGKLKDFLGNYRGEVVLGASSYVLTGNTGKTRDLIEKLGWNK